MRHIAEFGDDFRCSWHSGGTPKTTDFNVVVRQSRRHHAYNIDLDQMDEFKVWVARYWRDEHDPIFDQYYAGTVDNFLSDISVYVHTK